MLEDLKIKPIYDGFIFLAETKRNPPILWTHHHEELELNLVVKGSITYVVSGRTYTFREGSFLWIFPKQAHQLIDRTSDASYYVAVFKPSLIRRTCRGRRYQELHRKTVKDGGVLSRSLSWDSFSWLQKIMDSLMEDALDSDLLNRESGFGLNSRFRFEHGDPDMLNAGLHYLLIQSWRLYRHSDTMKATPELHSAVQKALNLLSDSRTNRELGEISKLCGMSISHLSRLFHRQIGVPLNRYRNSVRLNHVLHLQKKSPQKTLTEIAYEAGFGSYAQFHKIFSDSYKMGPRAFFQ